MLKVQLISYGDIVSSCFFKLYDYAYEKNMLHHNQLIVDLNDGRLVKYFTNQLNNHLEKYSTTKTLIIGTCDPYTNWRYTDKDFSHVTHSKYTITDRENVIINQGSLNNVLDRCWDRLSKEYYILEFDDIDSFDVKTVAIEYFGANFISVYHPEYKAVDDVNRWFHQSCKIGIVPYIKGQVVTALKMMEL